MLRLSKQVAGINMTARLRFKFLSHVRWFLFLIAADCLAQVSADGESKDGLTGDWGGARSHLSAHGLDIAVSYTGEIVSNRTGGLRRGSAYEGLVDAALDLDCEKLLSWDKTTLHISFVYPHGRSPSSTLVGDLFYVSNIDVGASFRLNELWLERKVGPVALRVGQLAADTDFFVTPGPLFFPNGGWPATLFLGTNLPVYPLATPGARLKVQLGEAAYFQTGIYNGNVDPADEQGRSRNPHGFRLDLLRGYSSISEIGLGWGQKKELPGLAQLGVWYHSGEFPDLRYDDTLQSAAGSASAGTSNVHEGNYGVFAALQQKIWGGGKPTPGDAEVYLRAGLSPADRNMVYYFGEYGVVITGLVSQRKEDQTGFAVLFGRLSDRLRARQRDSNTMNGTQEPLPDYEMVIEASHAFTLRSWCSLQPSIQWVRHPGGSSRLHDAWLFNLRTTVSF